MLSTCGENLKCKHIFIILVFHLCQMCLFWQLLVLRLFVSPVTVLQTGTEVSSLCSMHLFRTNFIQLHHVCMSTPQNTFYMHMCMPMFQCVCLCACMYCMWTVLVTTHIKITLLSRPYTYGFSMLTYLNLFSMIYILIGCHRLRCLTDYRLDDPIKLH